MATYPEKSKNPKLTVSKRIWDCSLGVPFAAERPNDIHLSTWVARDSPVIYLYESSPRCFLRVSNGTLQGSQMKQDDIHVE